MTAVAIRRAPHQGRGLWILYGALGAILLSYLISLPARGNASSPLIDGWLVASFELLGRTLGFRAPPGAPATAPSRSSSASAPCHGRSGTSSSQLRVRPRRRRRSPTSLPRLYPLVYVALVLLVRRQARKMTSAMWLDGLVAGLGAAGVSACFLFSTLVHSTGDNPAAVATNLAKSLR